MSRNRKIFIIAGLIALVFGILIPFFNNKTVDEAVSTSATTSTAAVERIGEIVPDNLIATSFSVGKKSFKEKLKEGSTAYDLMQKLKEDGLISFTSDYYEGVGYFVTSLDGTRNDGQQGKYWTYYVNEKEATVGASLYVLKDGDSVTWRYGTELKKDI